MKINSAQAGAATQPSTQLLCSPASKPIISNTSCHLKELSSNLLQSDSQLSGSCRQPMNAGKCCPPADLEATGQLLPAAWPLRNMLPMQGPSFTLLLLAIEWVISHSEDQDKDYKAKRETFRNRTAADWTKEKENQEVKRISNKNASSAYTYYIFMSLFSVPASVKDWLNH